MGIRGMKQRANELGGELRISNAAPGTLVEVVLPYKSAARPRNDERCAVIVPRPNRVEMQRHTSRVQSRMQPISYYNLSNMDVHFCTGSLAA